MATQNYEFSKEGGTRDMTNLIRTIKRNVCDKKLSVWKSMFYRHSTAPQME